MTAFYPDLGMLAATSFRPRWPMKPEDMSPEDWPNGSIPPESTCFFRDGNMIACVRGDWINIAESPTGIGRTRQDAEADLEREEAKPQPKPLTDEQARRYLELAETDVEA